MGRVLLNRQLKK